MATFWKIAAPRLAICSHCILSICNIYLFPVLVLRAGFAVRLLQFMFIDFLLLIALLMLKETKSNFIGKIAISPTNIRPLLNARHNFPPSSVCIDCEYITCNFSSKIGLKEMVSCQNNLFYNCVKFM